LTLQEALKSERKDKERAWAQNDFLKDELARSREDLKEQREENKALRGGSRSSSGGTVTPSSSAAAAAMEVVVVGDDLPL